MEPLSCLDNSSDPGQSKKTDPRFASFDLEGPNASFNSENWPQYLDPSFLQLSCSWDCNSGECWNNPWFLNQDTVERVDEINWKLRLEWEPQVSHKLVHSKKLTPKRKSTLVRTDDEPRFLGRGQRRGPSPFPSLNKSNRSNELNEGVRHSHGNILVQDLDGEIAEFPIGPDIVTMDNLLQSISK